MRSFNRISPGLWPSYPSQTAGTTRGWLVWTLGRSALVHRNDGTRSAGFLCSVEDLVRGQRLLRRDAAKAVAEGARALGEEGRPHLQDRVGEAELEDRPGHRREGGLAAGLQPLPQLPAVADGEAPHLLRARGG